MKKLNVAVLYGSQSTEHEISVITALQVMHALKDAGYLVTPVYIAKDGVWYIGNSSLLKPEMYKNLTTLVQTLKPTELKRYGENVVLTVKNTLKQDKVVGVIDAVFPVFHGRNGEDGTIHGFLTLLNVPIIGSQITTAAVGMDKYLCKLLAHSLKIPVLPEVMLTKLDFQSHPNTCLKRVETLKYPLIVKPNTLGSSIGLTIAANRSQLKNGLEVAFTFDNRVIIEPFLKNPLEVQISIMGNDPYELSITEAPLKSGSTLYSYEDKYIKNASKTGVTKGMASASRLIPAPITQSQLKRLHSYSINFFRALHGQGLSRIDFLVSGNTVYFNEINVIPGSLAFYLWEKSGYPFPKLVDRLVQLALDIYQAKTFLVSSFASNVLSNLKLPPQK